MRFLAAIGIGLLVPGSYALAQEVLTSQPSSVGEGFSRDNADEADREPEEEEPRGPFENHTRNRPGRFHSRDEYHPRESLDRGILVFLHRQPEQPRYQ